MVTANVTRNRKRKREFLSRLKDKPCMDCENRFIPEVMEFDHLDPSSKKLNIATMVATGYSDERILEEISKCELVCANCHRIRTVERRLRRRSTTAVQTVDNRQMRGSTPPASTKNTFTPGSSNWQEGGL